MELESELGASEASSALMSVRDDMGRVCAVENEAGKLASGLGRGWPHIRDRYAG